MTLTKQQAKLSGRDINLIKTIRFYCERFDQPTFNADTFYLLQLDRFLETPEKGVGLFFAKLVHHHLAKRVGWSRSTRPKNKIRHIQDYEWTRAETLDEQ